MLGSDSDWGGSLGSQDACFLILIVNFPCHSHFPAHWEGSSVPGQGSQDWKSQIWLRRSTTCKSAEHGGRWCGSRQWSLKWPRKDVVVRPVTFYKLKVTLGVYTIRHEASYISHHRGCSGLSFLPPSLLIGLLALGCFPRFYSESASQQTLYQGRSPSAFGVPSLAGRGDFRM